MVLAFARSRTLSVPVDPAWRAATV
jgi:hypothetical protein